MNDIRVTFIRTPKGASLTIDGLVCEVANWSDAQGVLQIKASVAADNRERPGVLALRGGAQS